MKTKYFSLFTLLIGIGSNAVGYEGPAPLKNLQVSVSSVVDSSSGLYSYSYRVGNPATNSSKIEDIRISISRNPETEGDLSSNGLTYCRHHAVRAAQANLAKTPMVPVGASTPNGWSCDYMPDGTFSFGALDDPNLINPGAGEGPFVLKSRGIPAIRDISIMPAIDYQAFPPEWEGDASRLQILKNKVKWTGKTVGPKAPPKFFNAIDFVQSIISSKEQAFSLGWINNQGTKNSLDAKLDKVKAKIQTGDIKTAKNILNAFLNEVNAQNGKHLNSEAYSLLFQNGTYLMNHL